MSGSSFALEAFEGHVAARIHATRTSDQEVLREALAAEQAEAEARAAALAEWRQKILESLEGLASETGRIRHQTFEAYLEPVRTCLNALLPFLMQDGADREIARTIVDLMAKQTSSQAIVEVSLGDHDRIVEAITELNSPVPVELKSNPKNAPGQVFMSWPSGGAEIDPEVVIQRARDVLQKRLAKVARSPEFDE